MTNYLDKLTIRLATGLEGIPPDALQQHADFLLSAQRPDGGFAGREGGSDLYYTGFAVRALAISGRLHGPPAQHVAKFLTASLNRPAAVVDLLSLIYAGRLVEEAAGCDVFGTCQTTWPVEVAGMLESMRRDDGGYARTPEGEKSSTYHTFLVLLCYQLIGAPLPSSQPINAFIRSQAREDGGFVEIAPMRRSGTNPTAAAIASLRILGTLDQPTCQQTAAFLADMQTDEGGLRANTRIPIADLLSTFTGLLTLCDLGHEHQIDAGAVRQFVESLQDPEGGFHGAAWDDGVDVEYTFYGLAAWSLLHSPGN